MPFADRPLPPDFSVAPIAAKRKSNGIPFGPNNPAPRKQKGAVAKITRDIKNGIVEAAENIGRADVDGGGGLVGYLEYIALRHPKAFCHLMGKLMPFQVSGAVGHHIQTVNILPIASGTFLSREEVEKARAPGLYPHRIEHVPQPEPASTEIDASLAEPEDTPTEPMLDAVRQLVEANAAAIKELMSRVGVTDGDEV